MTIHKKSHNKISKGGPQNLNVASKKPFKVKKKKKMEDESANDLKSEAIALQLEDDVPDFPRGGRSSLSRREREEIHAEVDAEFEGGKRVLKKKMKGKKLKNKSNSGADDLGSLFGDGIIGTMPRFANKITLRNISPGMKLWGVIAEVNEKDLVISLPGGLRGLVRSTDAIDPVFGSELEDVEGKLQDIFHIGQLVSCTVRRLDDDKKDNGKKKIWLSLQLSLLYKGFSLDAIQEGMILTAYVKSIEDHGYILHFGLPSFTGFLPKKKEAESRDTEARIGNVLQGVVRRIDKSRKVVYLDSDPNTISKFVMKGLQGISIDLLVPGMMVNARVQSTLENGILLSFLTYFTGTVDIFHLENAFPASSWKDDYSKNKKVNARILFVDPSTRAIGLTLNQHLVHNSAPPTYVKVGDIYENAEVVRVDRSMGLLLKIPSALSPTPAYVSVADVAEEEVRKLEKKFKEGSNVRVRVLGFKHLEGVAIGILKASAFDGPVFTHSDVKPGMVVRAKVIAVDTFGSIVQFSGGLKALCPLQHMSEFEISKPKKKFKVGAELLFRVLGCKSKRITVTHKKSLVKSKLPILSSYTDATDGLITHGWITKIENIGCFVHFYNGVKGFVPRSELGLEPGGDAASTYQVGQVVKCRVISSIPASRRINLSLMMKPRRVSEQEVIKLGSVVSGVVEKVTPSAVILYVNAEGYSKGIISTEHLADHHEHALLMKSIVKVGHEFDQLIILDIGNSNLILSAKYSLIKSTHQLPSDISQISPNLVVHGYICNIIETGCFVRFLGRLTGFSPRSKAMDDRRAEISEAFFVGQSVRSSILDVNSERSRITLSLKQSCCSSTDASFLQGYFLQEQKIAKLQSSDTKGPEFEWVEGFNIGHVVGGKVHELKEFGVVVSFEKYDNVFGFITHYQLGGATVEAGSAIQAVVLDITTREHIIDLSLKQEFLVKHTDLKSDGRSHKKKRKREVDNDFQLHQTVTAVVEVVKENYLVLSIPEFNHAIGYASLSDYNTQKLPHKQFVNGESVVATVMALPSSLTAGRLLLLLKSISEVSTSSSSKKAKKKSSYNVGSLVQAEITELKPLEMRVKFGIGFHGRIHITEVNDDCLEENPFGKFRIGEVVTARIVAKTGHSDDKKRNLWDLSIKPKMLTDSSELESNIGSEEIEYSFGQCITGYVYKVDSDWVWLTISRKLKAQLFILDTACEPSELQEFQKRFYVGKPVTGHVLSINKEKKLLRIVLHPLCAASDGEILNMDDKHTYGSQDHVTAHIREGDFVGGKISKILPGVGGLVVQVDPHLHGRVHFTEIQDAWAPNPSCGCREAEFVKCKVLEVCRSTKGTIHIDLSLRKSQCDAENLKFSDDVNAPIKRVENIEDLHPSMIVQGYVKNITPKGCFILLSRKLDAKILISNLSDAYVDKPEEEFPIGKSILGRVLSVEPLSKRVEVTLKNLSANGPAKSEINDLSHLHVGELVSGTIRRVESYGLFIKIDNTNLVGLCHVSQLPVDRVDNIESKYRTGEKVSAKILKVDEERQRISLGMKSPNLEDVTDSIPSRENSNELSGKDDSSDDDEDSQLILFPDGVNGAQDMDAEYENAVVSALAQAESRASVPPLEVNLDDMEQSHMDISGQEKVNEADKTDRKDKKREKKRAKEEREQEIRAAEERLLEKGIPTTADEFEKLVRSSPNSSFIWIKYMAFMLSLADVEKARSIAERALKTINIREENEKLNVWVAYFNLENKYGNPTEEAVQKVFQRALQYCDPEKLYLALLGMYERTEQHKLAEELLDKMVKKFKDSCTVWLRRVQWLLNQKHNGIHSVVQRALLSLPRHKHIEFISQAAILEFKCGVPERGRSLFEGVLREYPKRTDLWSVYLDQEIRLGDVELTRSLFERAISLSLPPKKMKFLFKKYLEYEKSIGDEERIESVKQKAMEYVESSLA